MNSKVLPMDEKDNFGVLLKDRVKNHLRGKRTAIEILDDFEFAHKVSLTDISEGESVIKAECT